jgi:hypothetical protein
MNLVFEILKSITIKFIQPIAKEVKLSEVPNK